MVVAAAEVEATDECTEDEDAPAEDVVDVDEAAWD